MAYETLFKVVCTRQARLLQSHRLAYASRRVGKATIPLSGHLADTSV